MLTPELCCTMMPQVEEGISCAACVHHMHWADTGQPRPAGSLWCAPCQPPPSRRRWDKLSCTVTTNVCISCTGYPTPQWGVEATGEIKGHRLSGKWTIEWREHSVELASYPAFMGGGKNAWFQPFAHALNLPRNLGNRVILVFFHIMDYAYVLFWYSSNVLWPLEWQWRWVLIGLGLMHNLHKLRIQWLEAMEKWPCGDCFTFYSVVLRNDVLIENNNYGCVIMQNN